MANCKSCGAEIEWLKTKNGKSMPVDAEPIMIETTGAPIQGYKSHFATCPNANQHRTSEQYP